MSKDAHTYSLLYSREIEQATRKRVRRAVVLTLLLAGSLAGVGGHASGRRSAAPRNVVTVAMYTDGTYSVDTYGRTGDLLTTAHLPGDASLAQLFPLGCQPDDGDRPCAAGAP